MLRLDLAGLLDSGVNALGDLWLGFLCEAQRGKAGAAGGGQRSAAGAILDRAADHRREEMQLR